jgi:hypothetical protein
MSQTFMAGQSEPYDLLKKRVLLPKEKLRLKSYIDIVLMIHPNYDKNDIEDLFRSLMQTGCTYATYSNAIIEQFGKGKSLSIFLEEFENLFGYSLYNKEKDFIDYNRLLVDLYSTFYNVGKLTAVWRDVYCFNSIDEAASNLIGECKDENQGLIKLFENGYISDGFDTDGKLKIKDIKRPNIIKIIGTPQELANVVLNGNYDNLTNDEVKSLFKQNNIEMIENDLESSSKLSGLSTGNINFWLKEFFKRKKIPLMFTVQEITYGLDDPNELLQKINDALSMGCSISVSEKRNYEVFMKDLDKKIHTWVKLNDSKAGHAMFLKSISDEGDLIVSSWGGNYLIPIEFCSGLKLNSLLIKQNNEHDFVQQVENNMVK